MALEVAAALKAVAMRVGKVRERLAELAHSTMQASVADGAEPAPEPWLPRGRLAQRAAAPAVP